MNEVSKYYCFSFLEFEVMRSIFQINTLTCFKSEYAIGDRNAQSEYNKGIFGLYKKKYIKSMIENWCIQDEIAKIFQILKDASYTLSIESKDDEVAEFLLFFSDRSEGNFVICQPGNQKDEYVKLQISEKNRLRTFMEESGVLLPENLSPDLLKYQRILPVTPAIEKTIHKNGIPEKEELWSLDETQTLICIMKNNKSEVLIALLKQPLQDKILFCRGEEKKLFIYSSEETVRIINRATEVNKK